MNKQPVIVAADADADEMNRIHGEGYGFDWVYPATPECPDQGARQGGRG